MQVNKLTGKNVVFVTPGIAVNVKRPALVRGVVSAPKGQLETSMSAIGWSSSRTHNITRMLLHPVTQLGAVSLGSQQVPSASVLFVSGLY